MSLRPHRGHKEVDRHAKGPLDDCVVGALTNIAPFAIGLRSKATGRQHTVDNFRPLMQQATVDKTANYYNSVFVPLGAVVPAMSKENVAKFEAYLEGLKGTQTGCAEARARARPGTQHDA